MKETIFWLFLIFPYYAFCATQNETMWQNTQADAYSIGANSFAKASDGAFLFTSIWPNSLGCGEIDCERICLGKISPNGDSLWYRQFWISGMTGAQCKHLSEAPDGSIYTTGSVDSVRNRIVVTKHTRNGDTIWTRQMTIGPYNCGIFIDASLSDSILVFSNTTDGGYEYGSGYVTCISATGAILFTKRLTNGMGIYTITQLTHRRYIIAAQAAGDLALIQLGESLDTLWTKRYHMSLSEFLPKQIEIEENGDIVVTGTRYVGADDWKPFIFVADSLGRQKVFTILSGMAINFGLGIHSIPNGGYFVVTEKGLYVVTSDGLLADEVKMPDTSFTYTHSSSFYAGNASFIVSGIKAGLASSTGPFRYDTYFAKIQFNPQMHAIWSNQAIQSKNLATMKVFSGFVGHLPGGNYSTLLGQHEHGGTNACKLLIRTKTGTVK